MCDKDFKSGKPVEGPRNPFRGLEGSDCRGVGRGLIKGRPLDNLGGETFHTTLVNFESLPYPVAPISPPSAGYDGDEIKIKELGIIKENFKDLNQRPQKISYKLIKSNLHGWYWRR